MRGIQNKFRTLVAVLLAGFGMTAQAVPISGDISILGGFTPVDDLWNATSLGAATGLDFDTAGAGGSIMVNNATGDFASLAPFPTLGTIKDIQFDMLGGRSGLGTVENFWAVGDFSFDLRDITVAFQNDNFITLSGNGIVSGAGFEDTWGSWMFSGQGSGLFSFSSNGNASGVAVAEPGSLALMGIGLVGMGMLRRRRHSA